MTSTTDLQPPRTVSFTGVLITFLVMVVLTLFDWIPGAKPK